MNECEIIISSDNYEEIDEYIKKHEFKTIMLVCGGSLDFLKVGKYFKELEKRLGIKVVFFSDFKPNPQYESVEKGVSICLAEKCDAVFAVGGGSAMDVAKCIKLYSNMDPTKNYLTQPIVPNNMQLIAIPTTAGTGSEATRYAVIYYKGEKQSVADNSIIPAKVFFDTSSILTLPEYQKKATMMDALCHAIESFWSVNSTEESKEFAKQAIELIIQNKDAYLNGDEASNVIMFKAANIAGKAINITQTTAGHAMSYKLTSLYGVAHGHATTLCVAKLWPYMLENTDKCIDPRGELYLKDVFGQIASAMGCMNASEAALKFQVMVNELELTAPKVENKEDYDKLKISVNPVRLKNNPIRLDVDAIDKIYHSILEEN